MSAELAFTFFDKIVDLVRLLLDSKKAKRADRTAAMGAVLDALQSTERYVIERKDGAAQDKNREWVLAEKWRHASIILSVVDPEFGAVCWSKGGYWMASDVWTDEMIDAKKIALSRIDKKMQNFMGIGVNAKDL
jgi:hypothetical protein